MDFLIEWPEVFATADQSAPTIAKLLVISCHGVPKELLSDCGASFPSKLIAEICKIMGIKKINTTVYHSQSDGLVERFHWTLLDMLLLRQEGCSSTLLTFCVLVHCIVIHRRITIFPALWKGPSASHGYGIITTPI